MSYTIEQIAHIIGADIVSNDPQAGTQTVSSLLTDSRSLCFPEQTLFFALVTPLGDGHRYIKDLKQHGVRHFVVQKPLPLNPSPIGKGETTAGEIYLVVKDTLTALQTLW